MSRRTNALALAIDSLTQRVVKIERENAVREHVHDWRYAKRVTGTPESFGGRSVWYEWECAHSEICGLGKNSTNTLSHVPADFPRDLR